MNAPQLTTEQEREVAELVAQGWDREAAILMVIESTDDVVDAG